VTPQEAYRRELILSMSSGFMGSLMANPDFDRNDPNIVSYVVNTAAAIVDAIEALPPQHCGQTS
jgi:hypothetical protein